MNNLLTKATFVIQQRTAEQRLFSLRSLLASARCCLHARASIIIQELFENCSRIVQQLFKNHGNVLIQFCHHSSIVVGICFGQTSLCSRRRRNAVFSPDIGFIVLNVSLTNSSDARQLHRPTARGSCKHVDPR